MTRLLLACLALTVSTAHAGQLHVRRYGLTQVAEQSSWALRVEVLSVTPTDSNDVRMKVRVDRVLGFEGKGGAVGERTVTVYGGVVWNDPNESPLDERLFGALSAKGLAVGHKLFLLPRGEWEEAGFEALRDEEATARKIEVFFAKTGVKDYQGKQSVPQLTADLADHDLAPLALVALARRGKLSAASLLASPATASTIESHLETLSPARRRRFFRDSVAVLKKDPTRLPDIARIACRQLDALSAPPVAALLNLVDADTKEGHGLLSNIRLDVITAMDAAKNPGAVARHFVPMMAAYQRRREQWESSDRHLLPFIEKLDASARRDMIERLLPLVHRGRGKVDGFVLQVIERTVVAHPSRGYLKGLATIDPLAAESTSGKVGIVNSVLEMGTAIATRDPGARKFVARLVEPLLRFGLDADEEPLAAYRKAVGKSPFPSKQLQRGKMERYVLAPGEFVMDLAGFRVVFDRADEEGIYGFEIHSGLNDGRGSGLPTDEPWFHEGVEAGRLWLLRRPEGGGLRIEVTLLAGRKQVPELLREPDLYARAEKAARKHRCGEYVTHQYERWNGRFLYDTEADETGKECHLVIGGYTGTIVLQ